MKQLVVRCMVFVLVTFGWSAPAFTEQPPAPRGELRIVDTRRSNRFSVQDARVEFLVDIDLHGTLVPRLATAWHWRDNHTLEMSLRQGVTFQNGERFGAEIVKRNWDAQIAIREYWGEELAWWVFPPESHLEIIDLSTIRFVLPTPDAAALVKLRFMPIANAQFYHALHEYAQAKNWPRARVYWGVLRRPGPWGTGPYKLVEGVTTGGKRSERVVLEAHRDYWDTARFPRLQRIVFDNTLDQAEALELVKTREGQVDLVSDLRPLETLRVARSPFAKVVKERGGLRSVFGFFNMRKSRSPWRDGRLRQAVNYAINRAHILRYALKGNGVLIPALLPPGAFGFDATLTPYPFDPMTARRLLREAGYPDGFSLTLIALQELAVPATVVSKMLEQVGFVVQLKLLNLGSWHKQTNRFWFLAPHRRQPPWPAWDIALYVTGGRFGVSAHLSTPLYRVFALEGSRDWVSERSELRQLYAQVLHTRERAQQQALLRQMERHTRDQAYFLFLYSPIQLYVVNKAVTFVSHPGGLLDLVNISVTEQHWSLRQEKPAGQK